MSLSIRTFFSSPYFTIFAFYITLKANYKLLYDFTLRVHPKYPIPLVSITKNYLRASLETYYWIFVIDSICRQRCWLRSMRLLKLRLNCFYKAAI